MTRYSNLGAIASFVCASCFILGLALIMIWAPDFNQGPEQRLSVLSQHSGLMQVWYFIIFVVFGVALLVLSTCLTNLSEGEHTGLQKLTVLVSYLWASYVFASGLIAILSIELMFGSWLEVQGIISDIWRDIYSVQMGLGEGVEWVGGIWMLLMTMALSEQQIFNKKLHYFGFFVAPFGLLTALPGVSVLGAFFGFFQLVWFLWVGVLLVQCSQTTETLSMRKNDHSI